MKVIAHYLRTGMIAVGCLFGMCSIGQLVGGNSSQTGNNGIVLLSSAKVISGQTTPSSHIYVYSQSYRPYQTEPGFSDSTVADDSGRFAFTSLPEGFVNLLVSDTADRTAFIPRIPVFADSFFTDTLKTLYKPGYLSGRATDTAGRTLVLSYVFVKGSPFYGTTKNDGDFLLGPIPPGRYTIGFFSNFQTLDIKSGQIAASLVEIKDTSVVMIYPDSISEWHW